MPAGGDPGEMLPFIGQACLGTALAIVGALLLIGGLIAKALMSNG